MKARFKICLVKWAALPYLKEKIKSCQHSAVLRGQTCYDDFNSGGDSSQMFGKYYKYQKGLKCHFDHKG